MSDDLKIVVADRYEQLELYRPFWESHQWHPNTDLDAYVEWCQSQPDVLGPCVLILERDGSPEAMVLGRIGEQQFRCRLGYLTIGLGQVRQLSILHGGVLNCASPDLAALVFSELVHLLKLKKVDVALLNLLSTDSHLFQFVTRSPGFFCRDHLVSPQRHWKTALPATQAEFLQRLNKKHRYWARRIEKQLEQDFPGQVSLRSFGPAWSLDQLMNDVEAVASKTYQRRLGVGFRNDAAEARRLALAAGRGWLRAYVLYLSNRPCAFWMGRRYKDVFFSDVTGYDPAYRDYELGTVVFLRMVEQLCAERVQAVDFGLGDALYKQRFGDQSWTEAEVRIFSPSLRGRTLNLARTSLEGPARRLKSWLGRTRWEQRLKTSWRKRLLQHEKPLK